MISVEFLSYFLMIRHKEFSTVCAEMAFEFSLIEASTGVFATNFYNELFVINILCTKNRLFKMIEAQFKRCQTKKEMNSLQ